MEVANPFARLSRAFAILALLLFGSGCATAELWLNTPDATANYSAIIGVRDEPPKQSAPSAKQLVVAYGDVLALVPLDSNGSPRRPFVYNGANREADGIIQTLGLGCDFIAWSRLNRATTQGMTPVASSPPQFGWGLEGVVITAYKLGPRCEIIPLPAKDVGLKIPNGYEIVVLPGKLNRPFGQVARERWLKLALTPLTLAADAVLVPTGVVLVVFRIMPLKC